MKNKILILNNHGLGDVVMSFLFFEKLLENNLKDCFFVLFKSELEKELFQRTVFYNENKCRFKLYTKKNMKFLFFYIFRFKEAYSLGINEMKSTRLFRLLAIKNYLIANPYSYNKSCHSYVVNNDEKLHKSILYSKLLGCPESFLKNRVDFKDFFLEDVADNGLKDYIVLSGGSGELEKHKRWPVENYKFLVKLLLERTKYNLVFVGSESEQSITDEILSGLDFDDSGRVIQLNGKTSLSSLINVLRGSSLVIGNDNGIAHIASSCDSRVLALFGSTDYRVTGPVGRNVRVIENKIECSPCYAINGVITGCENNVCMKDISPDDVCREALDFIDVKTF